MANHKDLPLFRGWLGAWCLRAAPRSPKQIENSYYLSEKDKTMAIKGPSEHRGIPDMVNHKDLPLFGRWLGPAVYEPLPEVQNDSKTHTILAKQTKSSKDLGHQETIRAPRCSQHGKP